MGVQPRVFIFNMTNCIGLDNERTRFSNGTFVSTSASPLRRLLLQLAHYQALHEDGATRHRGGTNMTINNHIDTSPTSACIIQILFSRKKTKHFLTKKYKKKINVVPSPNVIYFNHSLSHMKIVLLPVSFQWGSPRRPLHALSYKYNPFLPPTPSKQM